MRMQLGTAGAVWPLRQATDRKESACGSRLWAGRDSNLVLSQGKAHLLEPDWGMKHSLPIIVAVCPAGRGQDGSQLPHFAHPSRCYTHRGGAPAAPAFLLSLRFPCPATRNGPQSST